VPESGVAPIVPLHGGGTDCAELSWGATRRVLARDHRVFAPDWPGYGCSEPFRDRCTQEVLIRHLGTLLDAWKLDRATLVGVSMGGGAALGYALAHPERVERLVLVGSHGLTDRAPLHFLSWIFTHTPGLMELTWAVIRNSRFLAHHTLVPILADPTVFTGETEKNFLNSLRSRTSTRTFTQWQRSEVRFGGFRSCYRDRLGELRMPTLLVHGERDRLVPVAAAREAAERIPNAELVILPGCRHWVQRDNPDAFLRALRAFLAR
jgi:pimeloyl-ACP methyl ester carboxylesterase